jgi:hypothetical protein
MHSVSSQVQRHLPTRLASQATKGRPGELAQR